MHDSYLDVHELQRDRLLRKYLSWIMGATLVVSFLTLVGYSALLNTFEYVCLYSSAGKRFELARMALHVDMFAIHTQYATVVDLVLALCAVTTINLLRALALYLVLFVAHGFGARVLMAAPAVAATAFVGAATLSAVHVFYYVDNATLLKQGQRSLGRDTVRVCGKGHSLSPFFPRR